MLVSGRLWPNWHQFNLDIVLSYPTFVPKLWLNSNAGLQVVGGRQLNFTIYLVLLINKRQGKIHIKLFTEQDNFLFVLVLKKDYNHSTANKT